MKKFFAIAMLLSLVTLPMCSQEESKDERSLSDVLLSTLQGVNSSVSNSVTQEISENSGLQQSVRSVIISREVQPSIPDKISFDGEQITIEPGLTVSISGEIDTDVTETVTFTIDSQTIDLPKIIKFTGELEITIKFDNYKSGEFTLNGDLTEVYKLSQTVNITYNELPPTTMPIISHLMSGDFTYNGTITVSGKESGTVIFDNLMFTYTGSVTNNVPTFYSSYGSGSVTINGVDITDQFKNMPM